MKWTLPQFNLILQQNQNIPTLPTSMSRSSTPFLQCVTNPATLSSSYLHPEHLWKINFLWSWSSAYTEPPTHHPPPSKLGTSACHRAHGTQRHFPGATPPHQSPLFHMSSSPALPSVPTRNHTFLHEGFRKSFPLQPCTHPPSPLKSHDIWFST